MERKVVDTNKVIEILEKERITDIRKHNDQVIDEVAQDLRQVLKAKRKADINTIKLYMKMLELRLK